MMSNEMKALERAIDEITEIAVGFGLDFYPMRYEICPADIIYTFGAYGMPTRFSHWSFGKAFHKMKLQYDFNLSRIYELVINSNPCYAFLLKGNSLIQNKMIVAHVLAHCDFFKNNIRFSNTPRDMVESMAASAERIRNYEIQYGKEEVEAFLDHVLAIQEHINPSLLDQQLTYQDKNENPTPKRTTPYDDLWRLDEPNNIPPKDTKKKNFPEDPEKDLLLFIMNHSRILDDWHQDILTIIRNEMLYFWPQIETKIMNEGWATYWHIRIMREMDLTEEETIEFAKLNASVTQPAPTSINPYYLGLKIFEDIERRFDHPTVQEQKRWGRMPNQGRKKIFEVRELDSDISFLRNYLTKDLVEELDLYVFQRKGNDWSITDKNWKKVRDELVTSRINGGYPVILVQNGDYLQNGELYLVHQYEGVELDIKYLEKTLPHVYALWGRNVHLQTMMDSRKVLFSYNGKKCTRRYI
ncbi:stage V sporulation protein R [Thermoflavimicrobium daqui]|uniref:Stage V sporulation protein R n=2 Tax=Thermoflavimicrobium daqui TaxID=2137476 RepID=A0A364K9Z2_9BACL|nr:SpoVR family protein [Thermoflavimicrobium daqui]RAL27115.1 stage V sporulation protein R [Thermoflavimicrobium daqui]